MYIATHSRAQSPWVGRTSTLAQAGLGTFPVQRDRRPVHRVTKRTQFQPRRCSPVGLPIAPRVRPPTKEETAERTQNTRNQLPINALRGICHPRPRGDSRKTREKHGRKTGQNRAKPDIGSARFLRSSDLIPRSQNNDGCKSQRSVVSLFREITSRHYAQFLMTSCLEHSFPRGEFGSSGTEPESTQLTDPKTAVTRQAERKFL